MLNWLGTPSEDNGVVERRFEVIRDGAAIPGALWTPADQTEPGPLVLLGHGGLGHKAHPFILDERDGFAGVATAAIDGPVHGDRGGLSDRDDPRLAAAASDPSTHAAMVADWQATIDALVAEEVADTERIGYWGLSMGTIFGIPLVAAEPRIKVAALGLCGLSGPSATLWLTGDRLPIDAPRITCPVTFHIQWDDQLFDRNGAFKLFDLIGSADKRLQATPGPHMMPPPDSLAQLRNAVLRGLGLAA